MKRLTIRHTTPRCHGTTSHTLAAHSRPRSQIVISHIWRIVMDMKVSYKIHRMKASFMWYHQDWLLTTTSWLYHNKIHKKILHTPRPHCCHDMYTCKFHTNFNLWVIKSYMLVNRYSSKNRSSHTVWWPSYLHYGNTYTRKDTLLYWDGTQNAGFCSDFVITVLHSIRLYIWKSTTISD